MQNIGFNQIAAKSPVSFSGEIKDEPVAKVDLNKDACDCFECTKKESSLTKEQKQEIVYKARKKAAGWSMLFGVLDTAYYGLRSDKTVAKRFNLDTEKDKGLIRVVKNEQMKATIPAAIGDLFFGVGSLVTGGITWLFCKNSDPKKIDVE